MAWTSALLNWFQFDCKQRAEGLGLLGSGVSQHPADAQGAHLHQPL